MKIVNYDIALDHPYLTRGRVYEAKPHPVFDVLELFGDDGRYLFVPKFTSKFECFHTKTTGKWVEK